MLNAQERYVLFVLAIIFFVGTTAQYCFKKYPSLRDAANLIGSDHLYDKVDINAATQEELVSIPYIGEYTARQIILYREKIGNFESIEELKSVKGIREKNYLRFKKFIKI